MDQYHYSAERWLNDKFGDAGRWPYSSEHASCGNLLAGWKLPMNSFEKMLGWFPHTSREWIELIIVTVLLWLLMMAIFELELV